MFMYFDSFMTDCHFLNCKIILEIDKHQMAQFKQDKKKKDLFLAINYHTHFSLIRANGGPLEGERFTSLWLNLGLGAEPELGCSSKWMAAATPKKKILSDSLIQRYMKDGRKMWDRQKTDFIPIK